MGQSAFTIIELAISVSVLALLLGVIATFESRGKAAARAITTLAGVELRAERAMRVVTREVAMVGVHTLAPDPVTNLGSDTITFQTPSSVTATGAVTWNPPTRIELTMDQGEIDNGIDDDGDGLVDERQLTITRDIGTGAERTSVVCHGVAAWLEGESGNGADDNGNGLVDERGFSVRRTGDLLEMRLTLQVPGDKGTTVTWTTTTAVVIHN
jgi:type II secretory pathway pseudopilin PulG